MFLAILSVVMGLPATVVHLPLQRDNDALVLTADNLKRGEVTTIEASYIPCLQSPDDGQSEWRELLKHRPVSTQE